MKTRNWHVLILLLSFLFPRPFTASAQTSGRLHGVVTLAGEGTPLHGVPIRILELGLSTLTGDAGEYQFPQVPPGTYTVSAHMDGFNDLANTVTITPGGAAASDFALRLIGR